MPSKRMTLNRVLEIYRRQDSPGWSPAYEPGIKATREEAPSPSWAAELWAEKLQRYVHALSRPEQMAVRLVLFNPNSFELQEQRMMAPDLRPHPLSGHPNAIGRALPDLLGTISVAERLDALHSISWLKRRDPLTNDWILVPIPLFGDLLLFLMDSLGPYCVNWTVKSDAESFDRSFETRARIRNPHTNSMNERLRHVIEEQYYLDGGIRTQRLIPTPALERLDHNLRVLFLHQITRNPLDESIVKEIEDRVRSTLITAEPPLAVLLSIASRHGCAFDDVQQTFFRLLWERRVRVELIDEVVLIDKPLRPERNDVLARFSYLFERGA